MRMRYRAWTLAAVMGLMCGGRTLAQDANVFFIPYVHAQLGSSPVPDSGATAIDFQSWESTLSVFNFRATEAGVLLAAVYGKGASLSTVPVPPIPPRQGRGVGANVSPGPDRGVAFLEVHTSPGAIVVGAVERTTQRSGVGQPYSVTFSHGGIAAPVFRSLFPAGSVAVAGAVEIGQLGLEGSGYAQFERRRRMNVTLFNAGTSEATFIVRTLSHNFATGPLEEQAVTVPPMDVIQINGFPLPTQDSNALRSQFGSAVWVTVTADQPFLSYVSTIFDSVEAIDMPFAVYPSRLESQ